MKRPFTIFLDSACTISKNLYPKNTNTDFIIELPERLNFRRDWTVTLKTLFLSNKLQNVDDCTCRYTLFDDELNYLVDREFILKDGNKLQLTLNKHLACILGYTSSTIDSQSLRFDQQSEYFAPHDPNLNLRYPKNLIIGCNIVNHTIFGGQHVKLL